MTIKKQQKVYRWQPEVATSIIYWSLTSGVFFLMITSILEQMGLSFLTIGLFGLFCFLVWAASRREFLINDEFLVCQAIFKKNSLIFPVEAIEKVSIGAYGLTFSVVGFEELKEEERSFLMNPKTMTAFIATLEDQTAFQGKIVSI